MYDFHKIRKEKEIPIFKHKYLPLHIGSLEWDLTTYSIKSNANQENKAERTSHHVCSSRTTKYQPEMMTFHCDQQFRSRAKLYTMPMTISKNL